MLVHTAFDIKYEIERSHNHQFNVYLHPIPSYSRYNIYIKWSYIIIIIIIIIIKINVSPYCIWYKIRNRKKTQPSVQRLLTDYTIIFKIQYIYQMIIYNNNNNNNKNKC